MAFILVKVNVSKTPARYKHTPHLKLQSTNRSQCSYSVSGRFFSKVWNEKNEN
jgi:hypothetical protein